MKYAELQNMLATCSVLSLDDIYTIAPNFNRSRLTEWCNKRYIQKVSKGIYIHKDLKVNKDVKMLISNKIYKPSYISLETALKYYKLGKFYSKNITAISIKKTTKFETDFGNYSYRNIKPDLFFGFSEVKIDNIKVKLAVKEKALLDYFYYNIKLDNDIENLPLTELDIANLDIETLDAYCKKFNSRIMAHRIIIFKKYFGIYYKSKYKPSSHGKGGNIKRQRTSVGTDLPAWFI